jgi:hypothetical protein
MYTLRVLDLSKNQLTNLWMPKAVEELDLSENPLVMPKEDPKGSIFVRMAAEAAHCRCIQSIILSHLKIVDMPPVICKLRSITKIDLSHNAIAVCMTIDAQCDVTKNRQSARHKNNVISRNVYSSGS